MENILLKVLPKQKHSIDKLPAYLSALYYAILVTTATVLGIIVHIYTQQPEAVVMVLTASIWVMIARYESLAKNLTLMLIGGVGIAVLSFIGGMLASNVYFLFPFFFLVVFYLYLMSYNNLPLVYLTKFGLAVMAFEVVTYTNSYTVLNQIVAIMTGIVIAMVTLMLLYPLSKNPSKQLMEEQWRKKLLWALRDCKQYYGEHVGEDFFEQGKELYAQIFTDSPDRAAKLRYFSIDFERLLNLVNKPVKELLDKEFASSYQKYCDTLIAIVENTDLAATDGFNEMHEHGNALRESGYFAQHAVRDKIRISQFFFDLENLPQSLREYINASA